MLREVLDRTAERVGKDLKDQPEVQAELQSTIGNTYFGLGDFSKAGAIIAEAFANASGTEFGETNASSWPIH